MLETQLKVVNALGLHARPAAQLLRLAGKSDSEIKLLRADNSAEADARSILSVLTLAAAKGTLLRVEVKGMDERETLQKIEELFATGFGEK